MNGYTDEWIGNATGRVQAAASILNGLPDWSGVSTEALEAQRACVKLMQAIQKLPRGAAAKVSNGTANEGRSHV